MKEIDRKFLPSDLKDIGYKDSSYISKILENQADMIRYYQERDHELTKKLHEINAHTIN
jgi:predicted P-loop ATPase/GTPase